MVRRIIHALKDLSTTSESENYKWQHAAILDLEISNLHGKATRPLPVGTFSCHGASSFLLESQEPRAFGICSI